MDPVAVATLEARGMGYTAEFKKAAANKNWQSANDIKLDRNAPRPVASQQATRGFERGQRKHRAHASVFASAACVRVHLQRLAPAARLRLDGVVLLLNYSANWLLPVRDCEWSRWRILTRVGGNVRV
eukprot:6202231-Pleurochrysis_carterae.AAC.1